ncbi:MAG TPA: TlpA disulfide reductase family protein [Puia sp.]|nr:TlpA disulfide reductase family protein [Puia sp.]
MKKYVLLLFAIVTTTATIAQDSIWLVPALPQRGARVTIYFKSDKAAYTHAKTLSGGFYSLDGKNRVVAQDLTYGRSGNNWMATATVPDTSYAVVANMDRPDADPIAVTVAAGLDSSNGQPFLKSYNALAYVYAGQNRPMGVPLDKAKTKDLTEQYWKGLSAPPSNFSSKIYWYLITKKDTTKILNLLANLPLDSTAVEIDYEVADNYAARLGNKPLAKLLNIVYHQKYPHGDWNRFEYYNRMLAAKEPAEQLKIIREYKEAYPNVPSDESFISSFTSMVQDKLLASGDLSGALALIPKDASGLDIAGKYNNLAWGACERDIQIPRALALSKASLDTLQALEASGRDKPADETTTQYRKSLIANYALFADTYAYLLYKTGSYKEAFAYELKSLAGSGAKPQVDIIARYHQFMEKVERPSKVLASLATYIAKGQSDTTMEAQFKRLYKGSKPADDAYADLEAQAKALKQAEMVKTVMNDPASKFTLLDLNGNKVSLDSLKGKTVVVDFWATWCGPCKASFPAMQKLVERHKDDKNVAFLFVDTWESADDKKQIVADFVKKSPYTFHVLLDNDNKVVEAYKVSGIPTKFVIDKNGVTRFMAVGFDGNTDNTVDEIESMIAVTSTF